MANSSFVESLTYHYLNAVVPPTREERIGACHAFCGTCRQLKDGLLSGCANLQERKFSQSSGCQLYLAAGIVSSLTNVVMIIHSPLGCCSNFAGTGGLRKTMRASKGKPEEEFVWLHTNLDELDVVQGGIEKLKKAIFYAEKEYHPEAIIIANGCVPGIIGDDIDSLINTLKDQIPAKLVTVHCEGFKSRFVASGYDCAYHGLLRYLIKPAERYETVIPDREREIAQKEAYSRTVNIFNVGSNSSGDEAELSRLIEALGLIPRVLPLHASLEDLSHIGEAALNVSICATHDDYLLGHLKERFGTDYLIDTLPIGIRNTNRWIRLIAKHFHLEKEAEKLIQFEKEQLLKALEPFRAVLAGKSIFVGGGETRILTTAEFFASLGMRLLGVKSHNADRFIENMLDDMADRDFIIDVAAGQPAEELNLLKRLKPDLYIGHLNANGWVTKLGIPNLPLFGQTLNYMGYSGAFELARKAVKILKNTNFVKNISANVELPLSDAWYKKDPKENIKELTIY